MLANRAHEERSFAVGRPVDRVAYSQTIGSKKWW